MRKYLVCLLTSLLVLAIAVPVLAAQTTVQVWWLEDGERYGGDGTFLKSWPDDRIPPSGTIDFEKTGRAYHGPMALFYNFDPLDKFRSTPLLISPGRFAVWARYTSPSSGLPILDRIRGRLTIDDTQGTAYGSYVQESYVEGVTDEATVKAAYPNAVATDDPDVWLVGTTYYTVHGQT